MALCSSLPRRLHSIFPTDIRRTALWRSWGNVRGSRSCFSERTPDLYSTLKDHKRCPWSLFTECDRVELLCFTVVTGFYECNGCMIRGSYFVDIGFASLIAREQNGISFIAQVCAHIQGFFYYSQCNCTVKDTQPSLVCILSKSGSPSNSFKDPTLKKHDKCPLRQGLSAFCNSSPIFDVKKNLWGPPSENWCIFVSLRLKLANKLASTFRPNSHWALSCTV